MTDERREETLDEKDVESHGALGGAIGGAIGEKHQVEEDEDEDEDVEAHSALIGLPPIGEPPIG